MCTAPCQGKPCKLADQPAYAHSKGPDQFHPFKLSLLQIIAIRSLIQANRFFNLPPVACTDLLSSVIKSYPHVSDAGKLVDNVLATRP